MIPIVSLDFIDVEFGLAKVFQSYVPGELQARSLVFEMASHNQTFYYLRLSGVGGLSSPYHFRTLAVSVL